MNDQHDSTLDLTVDLKGLLKQAKSNYLYNVESIELVTEQIALSQRVLKSIRFQIVRLIINDIVKPMIGKKNRHSAWVPETLKDLESTLFEFQQELQGISHSYHNFQSDVVVKKNINALELLDTTHSLLSIGNRIVRLSQKVQLAAKDLSESMSFKVLSSFLLISRESFLKKVERLHEKICSLRQEANNSTNTLSKNRVLANNTQKSSTERVDIVVCVHNALDDVKRCITSLIATINPTLHRVIIVDDGSNEETQNYLQMISQDIHARYHRNDSAKGFTCALNKGISLGDAPYIVSLNSDTVVTPYWIINLLHAISSHPDIAAVGPLSNAASWQSFPKVTDQDGHWMVNSIPPNTTLEDYSQCISQNSLGLFPSISTMNGFCLMIKRSAYDLLNGFDESTFPRGYGEEDDFFIRLNKLGLKAAIADNTYILHSKSKSFTPEGRREIVSTAKNKLQEKHGIEIVKSLSQQMIHNEELTIAREWIKHRLNRTSKDPYKPKKSLRICWVQPHLHEVGGIRRLIEMSNALHVAGHSVTIATPEGKEPHWMPLYPKVRPVSDLSGEEFDIGILSDPDMVRDFNTLSCRKRITYHLAAYLLYRDKDEKLEQFYNTNIETVHIANSTWTAEQVQSHAGIHIAAIIPGAVDQKQFFPQRIDKDYDVVCYGSKRVHKGTADIETASQHLTLLKLADLHLPQHALAPSICRARVFVSACWHEGFNFCPLEAMSCGIPVVLTDDGGSREFAKHEWNALVVPPKNPKELKRAIDRMLSDKELRIQSIINGLKTAHTFNWTAVHRKFLSLLEERDSEAPLSETVQTLVGI